MCGKYTHDLIRHSRRQVDDGDAEANHILQLLFQKRVVRAAEHERVHAAFQQRLHIAQQRSVRFM